jgi:uncharacterized protein YjbJ (UPF0337 family)
VHGRFALPRSHFIRKIATILFSVMEVLEFERRRSTMKESTTDQIKGKAHEVKGAVKEKIGNATNDPNLQAEGQGEKVAGKIQKKVGQVEKVFGA